MKLLTTAATLGDSGSSVMSFAKLDGLGGGYPYGLRSLFMALFGRAAAVLRCPPLGIEQT